jgi:hypothetical protein
MSALDEDGAYGDAALAGMTTAGQFEVAPTAGGCHGEYTGDDQGDEYQTGESDSFFDWASEKISRKPVRPGPGVAPVPLKRTTIMRETTGARGGIPVHYVHVNIDANESTGTEEDKIIIFSFSVELEVTSRVYDATAILEFNPYRKLRSSTPAVFVASDLSSVQVMIREVVGAMRKAHEDSIGKSNVRATGADQLHGLRIAVPNNAMAYVYAGVWQQALTQMGFSVDQISNKPRAEYTWYVASNRMFR